MNDTTILLGAAALIGGVVRGFAGFGGPMTIIPVLSLIYPPALAIWIMAIVDLVANIYLIPTSIRLASARVYLPLIIGSLLTIAIGISALVLIDPIIMRRVICVAILLACCLLLSGWLFRGQLGTGSWFAVGALSGLVLGATLIAVVTAVFLNAASRDAAQNRANFIVWGCVTGIAMVVFLNYQQNAIADHLPVLALMMAAYFVGSIIGAQFQNRLSGTLPRKLTLALIMLVAGSSLAASFNLFA